MDYSSQQNQYPYRSSQPYNPSQQNQYPYRSSQPYNPSHFTYDRQSSYPNYQYQQGHHQQQYQRPQQQYSSYYAPKYSNTYPHQHPQTHHQWRYQAPPIHPPGVSSQPSSSSHVQLPYQQNLPQRKDGVGLGLKPAAVQGVAALAQLTHHAGLHGQSWYPQAEGSGPVIGGPDPGLGSGARPGLGPGPSRLLSHAGQSLYKGGTRGGGQHKSGGWGKLSNIAGVARCELCKIDCGEISSLKQHESGKRHRKNLQKLEAENRSVSDSHNVQKPSGDLKPGTNMKPDDQHKGARCELCKVYFGNASSLKQHESSKRHRKKLKKLEAENRTVSDIQNVQKPSGDLKPGINVKLDDLPKEEETKQKTPENIPLDTVPSEIKLETEVKINDAQCDVVQTCGLKREMLGDGGQEKKISKAKRRLIEPPKPKGGTRGGGQHKSGGWGKLSNIAGVARCELCKIDYGVISSLKQHESGKRHRKNLQKLEAENRSVSDSHNVQKPSGDLKPGTNMKPDDQHKGARCELCKVYFGNASSLKQHESSKRHRKKLKKLEAENRAVSDIQNVQKPSGDLKPGINVKLDDLPKEEETKQKTPENIPLDTVPSKIKLETEVKINDAQCDVVQTCGLKREMLGDGGQEKKISKAKRRLIEPPKPKVVIPLMCDLCNVKFDTRENLRNHLLCRKHKSKLKCIEGRLGLQALYPPNPVIQTAYHWQGVQQIFNGTQISDPIAGASVLPQIHNATPSATGVTCDCQQNPNP